MVDRSRFAILFLLGTAAALLVSACAFGLPGAGQSQTGGEWELHLPGGETICSGGTPYAFYSRQTGSDKLLFYFQPGGGCVAGEACDPKRPTLFDPSVVIPGDPSTRSGTFWDSSDSPVGQKGIFDLTEARNPFADYNMIYVPYCSGDLHLGNRDNNGVHHRGFVNATSALEWAFAHIPTASRVMVTGSSAGGLAAPFYAGPIARHYTSAEIAVLGDSSGSFRVPVTPSLERWGALPVLLAEYGEAGPPPAEVDYETAILVNSARFPRMRFARFDTTGDSAQQEFIDIVNRGKARELAADLLAANNAELQAAVANYHSYTVNGSYHMILWTPGFYTEAVNGIKFYEWVAALANGAAIPTVKE